MKKILRASFVFLIFSLVLPFSIFAEEKVDTKEVKSITLAEINLENVKIVSQENNKFNIFFSLVNGQGLQTDVRYGIRLIQNTDKGQYLLDEKIYDDFLTLNPNSKTDKSIDYIAPDYLDGEYNIVLSSKNSNNLPFADYIIKKVHLTSSLKGIRILPETCYLKVEGEKSNLKYKLNQGVDIKTDENLNLFCTVENFSDSVISVQPSYKTYINSSFGDVAEVSDINNKSIVIDPLKTKEFSVILPKSSVPNPYSLNFTLGNENIKSNIINIFYVIRGSNATINSLFLDKDYYKKGDNALISFAYFPSIDVFLRGRYSTALPVKILSEVEIKNGKGNLCAEPSTKDLSNQTSIKVEFPTLITSKCFNPSILITLKDEDGNILDQEDFNIKTTSVSKISISNIAIILILLLLIIISYLYFKKKKNLQSVDINKTDNNMNNISIIILLFLFTSFLFIPIDSVKADTITFDNLLSSGTSYFIPYDVQNPSAGGSTYTITTTIPVVLWFNISGDSYEGDKDYSSPGGIAEPWGGFYCGTSGSYSNCSLYYGLYLNIDILENYNNNLIHHYFRDDKVTALWNWFNNSIPLNISLLTNYWGDYTTDFNIYKNIPTSFGGVDKIHFLWMITKQDTPTSSSIVWQSDSTLAVNYYGNTDPDLLYSNYNPALLERDTLNMIYPEPIVDVKVDTVDGPINKSTGDSVFVSWTSQNTEGMVCECRCTNGANNIDCGSNPPDPNDPSYCGSGLNTQEDILISGILRPTVFDVSCYAQ
ncbi:TPA: hypothetical protein DIC38_01015 [Candidatus Nomurabacteria bacterium]|nr:MAG: hypothetical protein O210_OD1C00001G0528 [Parcubacteria bacterium RAAC4_OD1_1]HCY26249.1 hypothetical protein [Candidatus Nomurabacteria bacterium]